MLVHLVVAAAALSSHALLPRSSAVVAAPRLTRSIVLAHEEEVPSLSKEQLEQARREQLADARGQGLRPQRESSGTRTNLQEERDELRSTDAISTGGGAAGTSPAGGGRSSCGVWQNATRSDAPRAGLQRSNTAAVVRPKNGWNDEWSV